MSAFHWGVGIIASSVLWFPLELESFDGTANEVFMDDHVRARPIIGLIESPEILEELVLLKRRLFD
jgi:hypothetical protein